MFLEIDSIKIHYEFLRPENKPDPYILLLHGFTGSSEDWKKFELYFPKNYNLVAIDLIGHGKSDSPSDFEFYKINSILKRIKQVKEAVTGKKVFFLGYSMGGRVALNYAINFPYDLNGLILESTTPGISNPALRLERERTDNNLAEFILRNSLNIFVDDWMQREIFATQKNLSEKVLNEIRELKLQGSKLGYANSLLGFGAGKMEPVYDDFYKIICPTQLICGELDKKFVDVNRKFSQILNKSNLKIVLDAGHNVHLEQTKAFADIVYEFVCSF